MRLALLPPSLPLAALLVVACSGSLSSDADGGIAPDQSRPSADQGSDQSLPSDLGGDFTPPQLRLWSAQEWWASLSAGQALQQAGANNASPPQHLAADGALTWAIARGLLSSDSSDYDDSRSMVKSLQAARGTRNGPFSTTSAQDATIEFRAWSWGQVDGGDTSRVFTMVRVESLSNPGGVAASLSKQAGPRRVVLMRNGALELVYPSDKASYHDTAAGALLPWWDDWVGKMKPKIKAYYQGIKDAGQSVDLIALDTEQQGAQAWDMAAASWAAMKADSRWPQLEALLLEYGYDTSSGVPPKDRSNREIALWNSIQTARWRQAITAAVSGARDIFPQLEIVDYDTRHLTSRHRSSWTWTLYDGWGTVGGLVDQLAAPSIYTRAVRLVAPWGTLWPDYADGKGTPDTTGDAWEGFIRDVATMREHAASSMRLALPWVASEGFITEWFGNSPAPTYWKETFYHSALTGRVEAFLWYNVNTPQNPAGFTDALGELTARVGFTKRRPLTLEPVEYGAGVVISGLDCGGRLVWRVSWDPRSISDPASEIQWPDGNREMDTSGVAAWVTNAPAQR